MATPDVIEMVTNSIEATDNIILRYVDICKTLIFILINLLFRDKTGSVCSYEAISVIEHQGAMTSDGEGQGHYICDVKHKSTQTWYKTNDNDNPLPISISNVTKRAIVVLYKKLRI